MAWTQERVEKLAQLWAAGLSASRIANELGQVTRNAVIGKIHRLGLSGRAKPDPSTVNTAESPVEEAAPSSQKPEKQKAEPDPAFATPAEEDGDSLTRLCFREDDNIKPFTKSTARNLPVRRPHVSEPAPLDVLALNEYTCKWPIGDPGDEDFHFCGNRSMEGAPYCEEHARIAYQTNRDRRKQAASAR